MGMRFDRTEALLLLALLPVYGWWLWTRLHRLERGRKRFVAAVRLAVLTLLVLALAGPHWQTPLAQKSVVFAVDRSASLHGEAQAADWLRGAAGAKSAKDEAAVVSFGLGAAIEKPLDARGLDAFGFDAQVNGQFTNAAAGLQLAGALLPGGNAGRIVLLSDGEENVGDLLSQGRLLRDRGIAVDVLPLLPREKRDAAIEALLVPQTLYQAEAYTAEVQVRASEAGEAELRVYEDKQEIASRQVKLEQGDNRFAVRALAKEPGLHRYRAEIYMAGDEQAANNTSYAFSTVKGPPKVLIVEGKSGSSHNVESVLQAALIPFDTISPELLSNDFMTYTSYESILLNNVAATQLSQNKMEMIEQAVRDYGTGLIMLGGDNSFGLGGYFQTPIERALPVYMDLRGKRQLPSLGIMLVIDKSGSMSGDKMRLAQEAAARTVDLLRDGDSLGVLGFDSSPVWYVEPQKLQNAQNREDVIRQINSIPADGGTDIYPAVEAAYDKLAGVDAQRKHLIVLTDGQSASGGSYEALADKMKAANMTMSTVAIGTDADQALLERLAKLAGGRFYAVADQSTVPAIFSREAVLISRTYVVDRPFTPAFVGTPDLSGVLGGGLPALNGYIATTLKETAEAVLTSAEPDPILARWQYGAGRAVAWTSDVTGGWSANWIGWSGFPAMVTQLVKWTFPQFQTEPLELDAHLNGDVVTLDARSAATDGALELNALVTDESLGVRELTLTPTAPGEYTQQLSVDKPGVYMVRTELVQPGAPGEKPQTIGGSTSGFVVPYSPEYRLPDGRGFARLKQLAELTGGRVLTPERPEAAFAFAAAFTPRRTPLEWPLLAAALGLLLADIAARRVRWPAGALAAAVARLPRPRRRPAPAAAAAAPAASGPLDRLRQRREREAAGSSPAAPGAPAARAAAPPGGEAARPAAPAAGAASAPAPRPVVPPGGSSSSPAASAVSPPAASPPAASAPASPPPDASAPSGGSGDAMSRLLAAKRRSRK